MYRFTVFPNLNLSAEKKGNPYINDFISAINNEEECLVVNEKHKNPLLSILRPSRWGDIFIFNWFESIPDFKYGYLQSVFAILFIFILKLKKKKIIWIFHNKKPHKSGRTFIKNLLTYLIAHKSDYIITHASQGVTILNEKFKCTIGKTYYIDHPTKNRLDLVSNNNDKKKYDIIIWGSITGYKGVYEFLKFIKDSKITNLRICVVGNCSSQRLTEDIKSVAGPDTTLIFESLSFEELAEYISMSEFVLMPYSHDSILSSGTLMDSLSFGAKIIGPNTGSFEDYSKDRNLNVYVFNDFADIKNIIDKHHSTKVSKEKYSYFLDNNNWEMFIHKALEIIKS